MSETTATSETTGLSSQDRRTLLRNIALGSAGAAAGAVMFANGRASAAGHGSAFNPINPERAYDSRQPNYAERGQMAPNTDRVISVADGRRADGTVTTSDVVPDGATAVLINLTAANMTGPNFLSVTAGDVTTTETSVLNWSDNDTQIANSITVPVDADREIRVYNGNQTGSADVIVDIFGYYLPPTATE
jgi:hypothetical protein